MKTCFQREQLSTQVYSCSPDESQSTNLVQSSPRHHAADAGRAAAPRRRCTAAVGWLRSRLRAAGRRRGAGPRRERRRLLRAAAGRGPGAAVDHDVHRTTDIAFILIPEQAAQLTGNPFRRALLLHAQTRYLCTSRRGPRRPMRGSCCSGWTAGRSSAPRTSAPRGAATTPRRTSAGPTRCSTSRSGAPGAPGAP